MKLNKPYCKKEYSCIKEFCILLSSKVFLNAVLSLQLNERGKLTEDWLCVFVHLVTWLVLLCMSINYLKNPIWVYS
jgi:hypothetical protein